MANCKIMTNIILLIYVYLSSTHLEYTQFTQFIIYANVAGHDKYDYQLTFSKS